MAQTRYYGYKSMLTSEGLNNKFRNLIPSGRYDGFAVSIGSGVKYTQMEPGTLVLNNGLVVEEDTALEAISGLGCDTVANDTTVWIIGNLDLVYPGFYLLVSGDSQAYCIDSVDLNHNAITLETAYPTTRAGASCVIYPPILDPNNPQTPTIGYYSLFAVYDPTAADPDQLVRYVLNSDANDYPTMPPNPYDSWAYARIACIEVTASDITVHQSYKVNGKIIATHIRKLHDDEICEARGTRSSLDERLDQSLNEDGSLKAATVIEDIRASQVASEGGLIPNGSFEYDISGWSPANNVSVNNTDGVDGNRCLDIEGPDTVSYEFNTLKSLSEVRLSFWLKNASLQADSLTIRVMEGATEKTSMTLTSYPSDWTKYTLAWEPGGTSYKFEIVFTNYTSGSILLDGLHITSPRPGEITVTEREGILNGQLAVNSGGQQYHYHPGQLYRVLIYHDPSTARTTVNQLPDSSFHPAFYRIYAKNSPTAKNEVKIGFYYVVEAIWIVRYWASETGGGGHTITSSITNGGATTLHMKDYKGTTATTYDVAFDIFEAYVGTHYEMYLANTMTLHNIVIWDLTSGVDEDEYLDFKVIYDAISGHWELHRGHWVCVKVYIADSNLIGSF